MSNDTSGNIQMSDNNEDVQDGEAMKKELGQQGIEIEVGENGSQEESSMDDDEEDEQISTDDGTE